MSEKRKPECASCPYFQLTNDGIGECRYDTPTSGFKGWPVVMSTDFCSQHPKFLEFDDVAPDHPLP